jgi:hypothetical protein
MAKATRGHGKNNSKSQRQGQLQNNCKTTANDDKSKDNWSESDGKAMFAYGSK